MHLTLLVIRSAVPEMLAEFYKRLGLAIDSFEAIIQQLQQQGIYFQQPPTVTEWGIMAVIEDPEGRKIELYKNIK